MRKKVLLPNFAAEPAVFQAVIPNRKEIPRDLQLTVAQVIEALKQHA